MNKTFKEKRRLPRIFPNSPEGITFALHGRLQDLEGLLNDKGPHGIGVSTRVPIPPETFLDISITDQKDNDLWDTMQFLGEVRWCKPSNVIAGTYLLGIESHEDRPLE